MASLRSMMCRVRTLYRAASRNSSFSVTTCPKAFGHSFRLCPHGIKIHAGSVTRLGCGPSNSLSGLMPCLSGARQVSPACQFRPCSFSGQAISGGRRSSCTSGVQGTASQTWPSCLVIPRARCVYNKQNNFHTSSTTEGSKKHPITCNGTFTSVFPQCT